MHSWHQQPTMYNAYRPTPHRVSSPFGDHEVSIHRRHMKDVRDFAPNNQRSRTSVKMASVYQFPHSARPRLPPPTWARSNISRLGIAKTTDTAGMTPLHQAALDGNITAVRLLLRHGADVNRLDEDTWTPLHAACTEGHVHIARFLLENGADKSIMTDEGERPIDLVDSDDFAMIGVMLDPDVGKQRQQEDNVQEGEVAQAESS